MNVKTFIQQNKIAFLSAVCVLLLVLCVSVPMVFGNMKDNKSEKNPQDIAVNATPSSEKENSAQEESDWGDSQYDDDSEIFEEPESSSQESTQESISGQQGETTENGETTQNSETGTEQPATVASYPYLIKVNRVMNCITIYAKDGNGNYSVPYKAIVCSTARQMTNTPIGNFKTLIRYTWRFMSGNVYAQYASRVYQSILIHSVPYYIKNKGDLEYHEFNRLGSPASAGCIRVCVRDAKWIAENCPVGTQVIIYDDKTSPGPLGKPEMIKIPTDSPYRGWDPTDPDPKNPWNQFGASITSDDSVTVPAGYYNEELIVYALNTKALDTCGNVITGKVKVNGMVDWNTPGTYPVQLTVTDAIGRSAAKGVTIYVKERETTTQPSSTQPPTTTNPPTTKPPVEEATTRPVEGTNTDAGRK